MCPEAVGKPIANTVVFISGRKDVVDDFGRYYFVDGGREELFNCVGFQCRESTDANAEVGGARLVPD